MPQPLLVVARSTSRSCRFEKSSLREAINLKDFLEQTGEFEGVEIFQLRSAEGPTKEWVSMKEIEC